MYSPLCPDIRYASQKGRHPLRLPEGFHTEGYVPIYGYMMRCLGFASSTP